MANIFEVILDQKPLQYKPNLTFGGYKLNNFKHKLMAVMQHAVILFKGRVLLIRYSGYQGKGVEGLWGLPGGHYISGHPEEDLGREIKEETGLTNASGLKLLRAYVAKFPDGVDRFGLFYLWELQGSKEPAIQLSNEHTEHRWVASGETGGIPFIGPNHQRIVEEVLASCLSSIRLS